MRLCYYRSLQYLYIHFIAYLFIKGIESYFSRTGFTYIILKDFHRLRKGKRLQNKLISTLALCPNMRIRLNKEASNSTRLTGEIHSPLLDLSMKTPSLKMVSCIVGLFQQAMRYLSPLWLCRRKEILSRVTVSQNVIP